MTSRSPSRCSISGWLSLDDPSGSSNLAHSPTITSPREAGTAFGVILGTAGYMAPEQAMGAIADKRVDIWAFGVVLYEMLSGRRPFQGEDVGTLLTESVTSDPDLTTLPRETPASVRRLIGRCLEKSLRRRLRDIGDARTELDEREIVQGPGAGAAMRNERAAARFGTTIAWGLVAVLGVAVAVLAFCLTERAPGQAQPVRFLLDGPDGTPFFGYFALSPDGRRVAFNPGTPHPGIWIRDLDTLELTALPKTASARNLFWSPDSRSIGYFADGSIRTINTVSTLQGVACTAPADREATWGAGDLIIHGGMSGIQACGREAPLTSLDDREIGHQAPWFLPDGRHFIYLAISPSTAELRVASIDGATKLVVGPSDSTAVYSDGHLLFVRNNVLLAQPFDADTLTMRGELFRASEDTIPVPLVTRKARLSASSVGTIGFAARAENASVLTWFDRKGVALDTVGPADLNFNLALSPDEQRLAVARRSRATANFGTDIWVVELAHGGQGLRITDDPGSEFDPIWSRDGRTLVFNSNRAGLFALYRRPADGSGADEPVVSHEVSLTTPDWSPVEDVLLYSANAEGGSADIFKLPLGTGAKASAFLATSFNERLPAFSPDGKWVAYASNISGRDEVYVRAFAGDPRQIPVSVEGGIAPRWRGDGKEIFFLAPDRSMMAARVDATAGLRIAAPVRLFGTSIDLSNGHPYVVSRDGQRFLFGVPQGPATGSGVSILTNWLAATRR